MHSQRTGGYRVSSVPPGSVSLHYLLFLAPIVPATSLDMQSSSGSVKKLRSGCICELQYARAGMANTLLLSAVETLPHSEVSDVLPSCPYNPSYLVSRKLHENEALSGNFVSI